MALVRVQIRRLDPDLPLPTYAHDGDAGADLHARVDVRLEPGERLLVPTGVAIAVPVGYVGLVHPRSGLAHRLGVSILNAPGTIDAGYRGEILVNLVNLDPTATVTLRRGDRIAQLLLQRVDTADFVEVDDLVPTARGTGGHGSTGLGPDEARAPQCFHDRRQGSSDTTSATSADHPPTRREGGG